MNFDRAKTLPRIRRRTSECLGDKCSIQSRVLDARAVIGYFKLAWFMAANY